MKKKHTYENCYEILNVNPKCTWNELRKSYKLQVQKWHPDRFHDESKEKQLVAEKNIMEVNNAYNLLCSYYRSHGALPRIKADSSVLYKSSHKSSTTSTIDDNQTHINTHKAYNNPNNNKKRHLKTFIISLCIISFYIFIIYPDSKNDLSQQLIRTPPIQSALQNKESTPNKDSKDNSSSDKNPTIEHKNRREIQMQFTYGSSLSEVISIQGTPTRVEGNTWYYGESKVVFKNGLVEYWVRKPGHHLHANILPSSQ